MGDRFHPEESQILALDPGTKISGLAWFDDRILVHSHRHGPYDDPDDMAQDVAASTCAHAFDRLVVEVPRVYGGNSPADPNDLVKIAIVVGAAIGQAKMNGCDVTRVAPAEWKGQVDKKIMATRSFIALSPTERRVLQTNPSVCATGKNSHEGVILDVWDAVGIGLWHLGRLKR